MPTDIPTTVIKGVRVPTYQVDKSADLNGYANVSYAQGFNSNALNGSYTDQIPLKIERSAIRGPIKHATLRFKVTTTATAVQLMPTPYWLQRVELWQDSSREIIRIYNDELFLYPFLLNNYSRMHNYRKAIGLAQLNDNYFYTPYTAASTTKYFYLPLSNAFIEHANLNLNYISGDLWLRLYPASTPINIDGSTSYTPTLNEIALLYQTDQLSEVGKMNEAMLYKEVNVHYVLHPVRVPTSSTSYANSTQYIQTLEAVVGKVPFFMWCLRASDSNTSSAVLKNVDLGDGATHQITTPSGADILFNGSPLRFEALDYHITDEVINPAFRDWRKWYITNCSNDLNGSLVGKLDGFLQLDGTKYQFIINTPAASTSHVQTITLSASLPSTASFYIAWRGSMSAQLAYNSSTSALASAFNGLLSAQTHQYGPITSTWSATLSAGTSVTVTLTGPNGNYVDIQDLITIIVDNQATSGAGTASTAITTYGASGFPSSASYSLVLYAMVYASISLDTKGVMQRTIL